MKIEKFKNLDADKFYSLLEIVKNYHSNSYRTC